MKVFRVVLHSFGTSFVEADTFIQDETSIRFYRAGALHAEYLPSTVKSVEETDLPPHVGGNGFGLAAPENEP